MHSLKEKIQNLQYYFEPHLTTEPMLGEMNEGQESSDGFISEGPWIEFVGRTFSRQTMRWNLNFCCI
ncbi:MAG: hypothetical protein CL670_09975 [Balneola sp.]|nr:hypothetical protein [Balneola sp.]MBE79471.1 hypothetical protein [Balneola sp.]